MKKITYEEIYELYINQNLNQFEVAKRLNCSRSKISSTIKKYKIKKSQDKINQLKKKTSIDNYGVEFPTQSKEVQDKIVKTNLKRYGTSRPTQSDEVKEKVKITVREKYGVDSIFESKFIKEKIKKTNLEKYEVENPSSASVVKQKRIKTIRKKYGKDSIFLNKEIKQKIYDTNLKKYGYKNPMKNKDVSDKMVKSKVERGLVIDYFGKTIPKWSSEYSIPEMSLYRIINNFKTKEDLLLFLNSYEIRLSDIENHLKNEIQIDLWNKTFHKELKYRPDFKINDKIALNADGLYWHSDDINEDKYYHFNMRKEYEDLGLRIFQFRADEILDPNKIEIIKSMISNSIGQIQEKIGARKTIIKIVNTKDAKEFLDKNHIKGYKSAKHIGLYKNNTLVSIMSYKVINDILKIERFCSKINISVIGGFSKLLKAVKKNVHYKKIYYWVDLRYGTGTFLLNHEFHIEKDVLGWDWTDRKFTFNRLKCRANMDDRNLSENEHAKELGLSKIYDAGQRLYIREA